MPAVLLLVLPWALGVAETHRLCDQRPVPIQALNGKSPREARAELSRVLGPPLSETNQLPDGGAFARLEIADMQDGVSQRYQWGEGTLDVVFQAGKAQLVSLRLDEYETYVHGRILLPCNPPAREEWAQIIGIDLPKRGAQSRMGRGQSSYRYEQKPWMVRLRCSGSDAHCTDASVYLPNERPRPTFSDASEPGPEGVVAMAEPPAEKPLQTKQPRLRPRKKSARRK